MTCHADDRPSLVVTSDLKRVVLVGMPNTGKSTFFNRLTGASAFVGNWPGITVSFLQAQIDLQGQTTEFVDLPGIYDLGGFSEDEGVVRQFLSRFPVDLAILVLNASQLDRQLRLPLQFQALGIPALVVINMVDEADRYGIKILGEVLSERLGMPVVALSAKYGKGFARAQQTITQTVQTVPPRLGVVDWDQVETGVTSQAVEAIGSEAVVMPSQIAITFTQRLDGILLHPVGGLPLFFLGMFGVFWTIWHLGLPAQDRMDQLTGWLQRVAIDPLVAPLPPLVRSFLVDGLWGGLATVASFVPLLVLFFMMMAVLEDSGYLSRSAYLMDAFMARLGLDGRSFVLQMMGFGCNVPALMGTRVMRSQALRWLTMLVIPFSLCSARLQVFVFILAAVFTPTAGAIALFSLYVLSFVTAIVTALLLRGQFKNKEPFVLELPPYRFPTLRQVLLRGWGEVKTFIRRASGFITLGCVAIWVITNLPPGAHGLDTLGGQLGQGLAPVMAPIGIDPYLTLALLFGIIAKEVVLGSLAVIYAMNASGVQHYLTIHLTWVQAYSFCIFCLLYSPCLSTLATTWTESKSWKFTAFTLGFSLGFAWLCSFLFYRGALGLGLG